MVGVPDCYDEAVLIREGHLRFWGFGDAAARSTFPCWRDTGNRSVYLSKIAQFCGTIEWGYILGTAFIHPIGHDSKSHPQGVVNLHSGVATSVRYRNSALRVSLVA